MRSCGESIEEKHDGNLPVLRKGCLLRNETAHCRITWQRRPASAIAIDAKAAISQRKQNPEKRGPNPKQARSPLELGSDKQLQKITVVHWLMKRYGGWVPGIRFVRFFDQNLMQQNQIDSTSWQCKSKRKAREKLQEALIAQGPNEHDRLGIKLFRSEKCASQKNFAKTQSIDSVSSSQTIHSSKTTLLQGTASARRLRAHFRKIVWHCLEGPTSRALCHEIHDTSQMIASLTMQG